MADKYICSRANKNSCGSTGVVYLRAQEIQASPVSAQVDEGVARTEETELVCISTGRRTVHLITIKIGWVAMQCACRQIRIISSGLPRSWDVNI